MDFSPEEIKRFQARRMAETQLMQPQTTQKPRGRGGIATSLISEAAGTGGALGGAALGASIGSVVPGIGTLIGGGLGGLIGGFGGGFGGRAVENKVRDDEYRLKDALTEGLISGAFGAVGGYGRAAKGLKAAKSATEATEGLSKIGKFGLRQESAAKGISPGVRVGGRELSLSQADELGKFTQKNFRAGTPIQILEELEPAVQKRNVELANILSKSNAGVTAQQASELQKQMLEQARKEVPTLFNVKGQPNAKLRQLVNRFSGSKTVAELDEARKVADSFINFGRASAKEPEFEQAARVIRDLVDKRITQLAPEAKQAKTFISKALDSQGAILKAAKPPVGSGGGGIASRLLESAPAEGLRSQAGRGLSNLGQATQIPGMGVARQFGTGTALRGGANMATNPQIPQPQSLEDAMMQFQGDTGYQSQTQEPAQQNPYPRENLIYDIQRDPKNADEYIKQFQMLQEIFPQQSASQEPLNSTAAGVVADTRTGLEALSGLKSSLGNSGANTPFIGGLRAKNPFDTEAQNLQAQVATAKQIVGKALEGGVLRKEDEVKYAKLLPTMNDTDAVAQFKIDELTRLISMRLNDYLGSIRGGGGGTTLEDALMNIQGA